MSTKIYDAYRLPNGQNPFALVQGVSGFFMPHRLRMDAQEILNEMTRLLDEHALNKHATITPSLASNANLSFDPARPWASTIAILKDREAGETPGTVFHDRHSLEVGFFHDPTTNRHYARFFYGGDWGPHIREFAASHRWEDYSYWDNSERPDDIDKTDWVAREEVWERICDGGSFANAGLFINVSPRNGTAPAVSGYGVDEKHALEATTPLSANERLHSLLTHAVMSERMHNGEHWQNLVWAVPRQIKDFAATPEGQQTLAPLLDKITPVTADLHARRDEDPFVSHTITGTDLHRHALRINEHGAP